ncbi:MAG: histone deacetylase [Deltaproteobacteria bacterium]|nr:histone deacetylase [Deltaproteobacteria bacterium]MBW2627626.1 histone deacetylase [Deltaproteobacteria bacterium]
MWRRGLHGLPIAVVDDERFDGHRSMEPHPERPERLVAARAGLKRAVAAEQWARVAARPVSEEEALRVHSESYLRRLRDALRAGWGHIDADTFFCPETEEAAWLAAGGAVELCRTVVEGPVRRGLALLRPPGHHACPSQAMGFCLLNNIAIAAADALAQGLSRVAIVDWDVHHGNGTQDIFYDDARVLFISLHQSPLYPGTGRIDERGACGAEGYTVNVPMPPGSGPNAYGAAFREVVLPVLRSFDAELVLASSGLDGHRRDPLAQLELDAECFGAMTSALVRHVEEAGHGRLALFLEGGYDLEAIEESVCAMASALLGEPYELADGPLSAAEARSLGRAKIHPGAS